MTDERPAGRSVVRQVAYNSAIQAVGKAAVLLVGLASIAIATRYLGAAGYGRFATALAFVGLLGVLADLGLVTVVVREVSRTPERARELVANALGLRLALGVAVAAIAALLSLALPYAPQVRVAIVIACAPFLLGLITGSLVAVLQARLQMDRAVAGDVAGRVAGLGALVAVVELDAGFYAVVATAGVAALVTLVVTFAAAPAEARAGPALDRAVWRPLLGAAVPIGVTLAVNEIYFRADTLLISLFRPFEEVGAYALAFRVVEMVSLFPAVVLTSVFPLLARLLAEEGDGARRVLDATGDLFVAVGIPLAAGGAVLTPELVTLVGGPGFDEAGAPLRLLLVSGALAFVSGLLGYALIAADRQGSVLRLSVAALIFNLALNVALVPSLGIVAAAATAIASEVVLLGGGFVLVRRHLGMLPRFRLLWRSALAAAVMVGALLALGGLPVLVLVAIGAGVYAAALAAVGGIDRGMLEALRS